MPYSWGKPRKKTQSNPHLMQLRSVIIGLFFLRQFISCYTGLQKNCGVGEEIYFDPTYIHTVVLLGHAVSTTQGQIPHPMECK